MNHVWSHWNGSVSLENGYFNSPGSLNNIKDTLEKITWNLLTLFSCLKTVKFTADVTAAKMRQRAKFLNCSTAETDNCKQNISVTFNRWKNTPNGVLLHHFNYLVLHLFRQLGELKHKFSKLIGPYQWLHMQFQFNSSIPYQINTYRFEFYHFLKFQS